jgi:DNA-binding response OmpR family regulator
MAASRDYFMEESKGRILFIDDDRETCELVQLQLDFAGYHTVAATTVGDGLKLAKTDRFDLILLDWHFQDGTGIELCKMIRDFDGKTPIFFYTGVGLESEVNKMKSAGAQGCLIKPVDIEQLLKTMSIYVRENDKAE